MTDRFCEECKKPFQANERDTRRGRGRFCSLKCASTFNGRIYSLKRTIELTCACCQQPFRKRPSKLKSSKHGVFFCSRKCKDEGQRTIKEIQPSHYGTSIATYRSKFSEEELKCNRCGYDEFTCGVEIHHIDENHSNILKENLLPLCANCHRALHNKLWKLDELEVKIGDGVRTSVT